MNDDTINLINLEHIDHLNKIDKLYFFISSNLDSYLNFKSTQRCFSYLTKTKSLHGF
jgi:hypothetical protein